MYMLKLILMGLLIWVVYGLWKRTQIKYWTFRNAAMGKKPPAEASYDNSKAMTELVKDPACNMFIEKSAAIEYHGNYFCSESCKQNFIQTKEASV